MSLEACYLAGLVEFERRITHQALHKIDFLDQENALIMPYLVTKLTNFGLKR